MKLNFLEDPENTIAEMAIKEILERYGKAICDYAKDYFEFEVDIRKTINGNDIGYLFITVPKIGTEYRILGIEYIEKSLSEGVFKLTFYTYKTRQEEIADINVRFSTNEQFDLGPIYSQISSWINSALANQTFRYLVEMVREEETE